MEDFGILWIWGFCGDSHRFFCGYGMGMGIKIQSPRQPCKQLKGGTSQIPVRVQPPKDSSSDEALNVHIHGQPGPHPPSVPSSSSPAECQGQSKLCISLSLEMKKYCKPV